MEKRKSLSWSWHRQEGRRGRGRGSDADAFRQPQKVPRGPDVTPPPRLDLHTFPIQGPQAPAAWAHLSPKSCPWVCTASWDHLDPYETGVEGPGSVCSPNKKDLSHQSRSKSKLDKTRSTTLVPEPEKTQLLQRETRRPRLHQGRRAPRGADAVEIIFACPTEGGFQNEK